MKSLNSVRLEGYVESCRILGRLSGKTLAKLCVVTLHPAEGEDREADPSLNYKHIRHMVRLVSSGAELKRLGSIHEAQTAGLPLDEIAPCHVEGFLCSEGSENFVDVRDGGFSFTEKIQTQDNNEARLQGKVLSVTFTDQTAKLCVGTDQGPVNVFVLKRSDMQTWNSIAEGKVAKEDWVSLSGPLVSGEYTDGRSRICASMITPHFFQKLNLKKDLVKGPSL